MSKRNEYDEIYLKNDNFGMEYTYKNHRQLEENDNDYDEYY